MLPRHEVKFNAFYMPEMFGGKGKSGRETFVAMTRRSLLWHTLTKFDAPSPTLSSPIDEEPKNDALTSAFRRAHSSFDDRSKNPQTNANDPSNPERAMFQPGAILEARFRIVRLLGRGGMGEVYEAEDLVLSENVALKTLLPQIVTDEHFRARFRREVLLARKVTHRNVCRIFEVFGDTPVSSSAERVNSRGLPFMTMQLLHGQTLAQFLAAEDGDGAEGKKHLTPQQALPLVIQMAAALQAAHEVGVVHRDFKSSNVFLADGPGTAQPHVVVTDFGLARMSEASGAGGISFTGQDEFVGTPLYMAPEQVEGAGISPATDIYALGVVLYETVTGSWPFLGKTPRETANLRLKTSPAPPKSLIPTLDPKWNAVILRCLERDPADRFQSVQEVVESLEGETAALRRRTKVQRRRLTKMIQISVCSAFAVAAGLLGYRLWPKRITTGKQASVAVVRFQSLSRRTEKDWIGVSLEETLTRELAASDGLRVIPAEDVATMRQDLVLPATGKIDQATLEQIQSHLGVDDLILSDYELSGQPNDEQIRVGLQIVNPSLGSEPISITQSGRTTDLFALSDLLARSIRTALKVGDISAADRTRLRAALPENTAASRAYYDGLEKLRQFDPLGARDFLKDAVQNDPEAPLPHFELSKAWDILGYDKEALAESKRAQETSQELSTPEQRQIECRVLELQRLDWDSAVSACRGVWELRRRLGDGLRLVEVQFSANRQNDAIATLAVLRKELPVPENSDPRIDIAEAKTREALTQYSQMESVAQTALGKAKKLGAKMFEAQALVWSCMARQNLDKLEAAKQDCITANDIYSTVGDKIEQARALTSLANVLSKLRDPSGASKEYEQALNLATSVGSLRDRCDALINRAGAYLEMKNLKAAAEGYGESLRLGETSGFTGCQARASEALGMIASTNHDFPSARKALEDAAKSYTQLNMSADLARVQSNTGALLWQQGDPVGARVQFEEAARRRRDLGLRDGLGLTLVQLGDVLLAQDEVDQALAAYREAAQIQNELHEDGDAEVTQISIARALVENGGAADVEPALRKAVVWCAEAKDGDNEVFARDVLIRSLLARNDKNDGAVGEAHVLQSLLAKASDEETILSARITVARALAIQPSFPQASIDLRQILGEAQKRSFFMQALSATSPARSRPVAGHQSQPVLLTNLDPGSKVERILTVSPKSFYIARAVKP